jgi:hypothetical protein
MNRTFTSLVSLALISAPLPANAQNEAIVGIRAQGMGGAFTAVADDSSATWWNPAGLAAGGFFNLILEASNVRQPAGDGAVPAWHGTSRGFSVAYPALGLSYYRLRISEIERVGSTAASAGSREDTGAESVHLRSLILNQFGATIGQSLGAHLVLASTVKLVRAGVAAEVQGQDAASLETADDLHPDAEAHTSLDVGAMAKFGGLTLGLVVRNATQPTFGDGVTAFTLSRQVRTGIAFSSQGASGTITVAADLDLTRTGSVLGEARRLGAGIEIWTKSRRLGFRGGGSANTLGAARTVPSGGVSVAFRPGTYVDAFVTAGDDVARRGWGTALRVTF